MTQTTREMDCLLTEDANLTYEIQDWINLIMNYQLPDVNQTTPIIS